MKTTKRLREAVSTQLTQSKRAKFSDVENEYKRSYNKRINYKSDEFLLEFLNGILIQKVDRLAELRLIEEEHLLISNCLSKRLILLYDKFSNLRFDFEKYFSSDALLCLRSNIEVSRNQTWLCSICLKDSSTNSVGCDYCNNFFHFSCVGLKKNPVGSYFCSSCLVNL